MAPRPRWLSPDLLLVLVVLGFAAALVLLVTRGGAPDEGQQPARRDAVAAEAASRGELAPAIRNAEVLRPPVADEPGPRPETPTATPGPAPAAPTLREPAASEARAAALPRDPAPTDPSPRLSIQGRVLEAGGQPVSGLAVTARPLDPHAGVLGPARKLRSRADGRFSFEGLTPGRYRLATEETAQHRASSSIARAGSQAVDLVLTGRLDLRAFGRITDDRDAPMAGVEVQPFGQNAKASSNDDGRYDLRFSAPSGAEYVLLRFRAKGYADHEVRVAQAQLAGEGLEQDARLEPEEGRFSVQGRLTAERGELPAAVNVMLRSTELRSTLHGLANAEGEFRIEGVEEARDWRVSVRPGQRYGDVQLGPLHLHRRSDPIEVLLPSLDTGSVVGRLVDPEGRPVPHLVLTVTSESARTQTRELRSNDRGEFQVEGVPAGSLRFETRAVPFLRVAGIDLDPGEREEVDLVLDVGEHAFAGRVLGERGKPVAGADIRLDWQGLGAGTRSSSFRRTVSDPDGAFRFRQLGPGPHGLSVRAPGHRPWRAKLGAQDARAGVEVRLEVEP